MSVRNGVGRADCFCERELESTGVPSGSVCAGQAGCEVSYGPEHGWIQIHAHIVLLLLLFPDVLHVQTLQSWVPAQKTGSLYLKMKTSRNDRGGQMNLSCVHLRICRRPSSIIGHFEHYHSRKNSSSN